MKNLEHQNKAERLLQTLCVAGGSVMTYLAGDSIVYNAGAMALLVYTVSVAALTYGVVNGIKNPNK